MAVHSFVAHLCIHMQGQMSLRMLLHVLLEVVKPLRRKEFNPYVSISVQLTLSPRRAILFANSVMGCCTMKRVNPSFGLMRIYDSAVFDLPKTHLTGHQFAITPVRETARTNQ